MQPYRHWAFYLLEEEVSHESCCQRMGFPAISYWQTEKWIVVLKHSLESQLCLVQTLACTSELLPNIKTRRGGSVKLPWCVRSPAQVVVSLTQEPTHHENVPLSVETMLRLAIQIRKIRYLESRREFLCRRALVVIRLLARFERWAFEWPMWEGGSLPSAAYHDLTQSLLTACLSKAQLIKRLQCHGPLPILCCF